MDYYGCDESSSVEVVMRESVSFAVKAETERFLNLDGGGVTFMRYMV